MTMEFADNPPISGSCRDHDAPAACSRRAFLRRSGTATITLMLTGLPGVAGAVEAPAWIDPGPDTRIAALSDIVPHTPITFTYPDAYSTCFLVQLDGAAGGGVGPNRDIVAFHSVCPHMGGPLLGTYQAAHAAAGPCPLHLSTFDLRRHGMIISGHSTESLPQVTLKIEDGWLVATGMMGLIYGVNP